MDHIDQDTDEVRSLQVGEVSELFEETAFPTTTGDVLEEFADVEIEYPRDSDRSERYSNGRATRPTSP